jgi:beta-glucosidase
VSAERTFPDGFLWGAATAPHQVEGANTGSDWWEWETRPGSVVAEPSGDAIDHRNRYAADIALLASLGLGVYRFGVEWARVEPEDGVFDDRWLDHYAAMVACVRSHGMVPMVTLQHFTLPIWVARRGGWLSPATPELFARYCRRVMGRLGSGPDLVTTINEPGVVPFGGYLAPLGFPPGRRSVPEWERASEHIATAHVRGRAAVREAGDVRVGATHSLAEWESNRAGRPVMELMRRRMEDVFLDACADDDYIGVQTYTRVPVRLPLVLGPGAWGLARSRWLQSLALPWAVARGLAGHGDNPGDDDTRTDMGYEYRPQAVAATVRRVAERYPGKDIIVTEHGIATDDDARRVAFIAEGLAALHQVIADGIPLRGYVHWSAFDNFEWALGYRMRFGLVGVDRSTQERQVKPSARFLGEIARTGRLSA